MERFAGKVAVVTGAAGGIGTAIVKELLRKGLIVVGLDLSIEQLRETEKEISTGSSTKSGAFYHMRCDITAEAEIRETFQSINTNIGTVYILVNNAAVCPRAFLTDVTEKEYDKVFDTNVKGLLLCAREALKFMADNSIGGHIVNMNSVTSLRMSKKYIGWMLYPASKQAVRAISEGLRREIMDKKLLVKISEISPGLVKTPLTKDYTAGRSPMEVLMPQDVAKGCIAVLNTPPNVLISELTIQPVYDMI